MALILNFPWFLAQTFKNPRVSWVIRVPYDIQNEPLWAMLEFTAVKYREETAMCLEVGTLNPTPWPWQGEGEEVETEFYKMANDLIRHVCAMKPQLKKRKVQGNKAWGTSWLVHYIDASEGHAPDLTWIGVPIHYHIEYLALVVLSCFTLILGFNQNIMRIISEP